MNSQNLKLKFQRPLIITIFCLIGIIWLFLIFIGIIGILINLKEVNILIIIRVIIEISIFIIGIIALRLYWLMKKEGVLMLALISGTEIISSLFSGNWPLSLACGCQFPIIFTILGLIYLKQMS